MGDDNLIDLYNNNKELFEKYILDCKKVLNALTLSDEELKQGYYIYQNLLKSNLNFDDISVGNAIKMHRLKMINVKQNHTFRVVEDANKVCEKIGVCDEFVALVKLSALFHDIARFPQAVTSNTFFDKDCILFNGLSHAEYGYKMLYEDEMIKEYNIPKEYCYAIALAVLNHQRNNVLQISFNSIDELDPKLLTGNVSLNNEELTLVSTLVQLIRDVDKIDILYQHITGEYPVINPSIKCKVNGRTLDEICKKYNVDKKVVKEYNDLISDDISNIKIINIPSSYIDLRTLIVPRDIRQSFFRNEIVDLKELQKRDDYTFIVGMWWRLSHFLNDINFVANLEILKENGTLDKIYNEFPLRYRFLVTEAFEFAESEILDKKIEENKGKVFVKK